MSELVTSCIWQTFFFFKKKLTYSIFCVYSASCFVAMNALLVGQLHSYFGTALCYSVKAVVRLKAKDFVVWILAGWTCWILLRNVTLIRAVSSCWVSGKDSAEAVLSPNHVLCLSALGHARGAEIRKEEKNTSLVHVNSLGKKAFRCFLLLLGCTFQPPFIFLFLSSYEGTKLFFNNGGGSVFCCCRAAVKKIVS